MRKEISTEAHRIVSNMCVMPLYNGTATVDVVEEILERYSNPIFCHGEARNMVFTPVTPRMYTFKTVSL
jgi:hypothetical protein